MIRVISPTPPMIAWLMISLKLAILRLIIKAKVQSRRSLRLMMKNKYGKIVILSSLENSQQKKLKILMAFHTDK